MLTKKHFEAIADIFASYNKHPVTTTPAAYNLLRYLAYDVADYLTTQNPRFNIDKFIALTQIEEEI